jgi:hypothetical protein
VLAVLRAGVLVGRDRCGLRQLREVVEPGEGLLEVEDDRLVVRGLDRLSGRSRSASKYAGPLGKVSLSVDRSTAYLTSSEVTSVPSSYLTPSFSV